VSEQIEKIAVAATEAAGRIQELIRPTPLQFSQQFSAQCGAEVFFKLENLQHTGSFKLRGAANCLMALSNEQRARGCVAASSGNHGAAVAYAMRALDVRGVIFVPEQTSAVKVEAIRDYGGEVRFFGNDGLDTEQHAREYANSEGLYYVSPYNDAAVIAGQGTCGIEIARQLPDVDAVFIAVGGGGLLGGVGSVLKVHNPDIRIFACQPEASAVMAKSVAAGRILDLPSEKTLSDGTAGGVEPGAITFALCQQLADEFVLVSEAGIAAAMREYADAEEASIEGAAGVAIAALQQRKDAVQGLKVAVIICGGNVSQDTLDAVLSCTLKSS
jgi:threonine dehydratase